MQVISVGPRRSVGGLGAGFGFTTAIDFDVGILNGKQRDGEKVSKSNDGTFKDAINGWRN